MIRKTIAHIIIGSIPFIWFLAGCSDSVSPAYNNSFVKYYGEDEQQEGVDLLVSTADQSLLLLGTSHAANSSINSLYVVKTDWNGNVLWSKKIGGPADIAKDIEFANDGGFVILSETRDLNNNADIKVIKIDESGEEVASVIYRSPSQSGTFPNDYPVSITPATNGYIVTGTTEYNTAWASSGIVNNTDALHLRLTDDLGIYDTAQFYLATGESENDFGIKTVKLREDRYYLFGTSQVSYEGPVNDDYNFWYFGMNNGGIQTGHKGIIGQDVAGRDERLYAVCPAFSGGFFLVGTFSANTTANRNELYIAHLYLTGGELARAQGDRNLTIYKGNESRNITPVSVAQSFYNRPGYLIAGNEGDAEATNIWLSKVDETGELVWSSSFGSISARNKDTAGAVAELPDGSILLLGTVNLNITNLKMALFKLNGEGKLAN